MERITTRKEMAERLRDVRAVEIQARDSYVNDISTFKNMEIISTIAEIKKDEDLHISLLTEIIDLLES